MRTLICLLMSLAFSAPSVIAQQQVRDKVDSTRRSEAALRLEEEAQRKIQAVDILKGVVDGADDIRETRTRLAIITNALDLLWKHDESYTRAKFNKAASVLLERFASDTTAKRERAEIRASMGVLLKSFARHDAQAAERLLDKFQKLLEDVMKGSSVSLAERLSLAEAGLESDAAQSAALAAKVLEGGVPGSFPSYLNELERRDPTQLQRCSSEWHSQYSRVGVSILRHKLVYFPLMSSGKLKYRSRSPPEVAVLNRWSLACSPVHCRQ